MAHCSTLSEVAATNAAEVENVDRVADAAEVVWTVGVMPRASDGEGHVSSLDTGDNLLGEGAPDDKNSRTYYFGSSTITIGNITEMVEKGYFAKGEACAPGAKTVPNPNNDEAIVFEDFFIAGLRMPLHPALADILIKFQAQLHQLTPMAIAQLSKYFWAVGSFRGMPEGNAFAKQYEPHYQPKKVETPNGEMMVQ
jgi:hypothetical protein